MLVGSQAVDFSAKFVMHDGSAQVQSLFDFKKQKYAVLFFYPLDFTFVCPSELIALNHHLNQFKNTVVMGISIDSEFTHMAWRKTPIEQGGIGPIQFPLVSDITHQIMRTYESEHPAAHVAMRSTVIIDPQNIIRAHLIHDLPIGRNISEIIRVIDAIDFHSKNGEVCPAGWRPGKQGMKPSTEGVASYLKQSAHELKENA